MRAVRAVFGVPAGQPDADADRNQRRERRNAAQRARANAQQNQNWFFRQFENLRNWFPRIQFTYRYVHNRGGAGQVAVAGAPQRGLLQQLAQAQQPRAPQMSMEQAIERVREIFPQVPTNDIEREIQRSYGNVELAIINISNRMLE